MNTSVKARWVIVLAICVLALYAAGSAIWARLHRPELDDSSVALLRQLAVSDTGQLAEMLDHCVVYVEAGDFVMGSDDRRDNERPRHAVYLDAFEIDRYEVTNAQYQRFLRAAERSAPPHWNGDTYPIGQADYPVVGVSWADADAYCAWAGKRLPTEAEWEKACRGTDGRLYPWGDEWEPQRANVDVSARLSLTPLAPGQIRQGPANRDAAWPLVQVTPASPEHPGLRPVGSCPASASPYGVMDMTGNASEWVADWYNWDDYSSLPTRNPLSLGPHWNHSLRGSSWANYRDISLVQDLSRCSARNSAHIARDPRLGFRCARSVP
jgi:formylglycine-generating enzyme required for sulfatase activity